MAKIPQELLDKLGSYVKELYGKSEDLAYLIQLGWIVFRGREYNVEKGMQPLDVINALQSGKDVYFQHVPDKASNGEKSYSVSFKDDELKTIPCTKDLIDGKVREAALKELDAAGEMMWRLDSKNKNFLALRDKCADVHKKLSETVDKSEFMDILNEYVKDAEQYYMKHAPANLNKGQLAKTSIAYKLLGIRNAVANGVEAESPVDKIKEAQTRIAAKFVAARAAIALKSDDLEVQQAAKQLQEDPVSFQYAVEKTMEDESFQYLYGKRELEKESEMLARLKDAAGTKASKIVKQVAKERKNPTPDRLQAEAIMKERKPKRTNPHKMYSSMSLQQQAPIADVVSNVRRAVEQAGGSMTSSPEFIEFRRALSVSDMRLRSGNEYMDVQAQLQQLGDAADEYYEAKIDKKPDSRGNERLLAAKRIRDLCDQVAQGKVPQPKTDEQLKKEIIAERAVRHAANYMMESPDPKVRIAGKKILLNKALLEKQMDNVMKSDIFQKLTGSAKALEKTFNTKTADIMMAVGTIKPKDVVTPQKKILEPEEKQLSMAM